MDTEELKLALENAMGCFNANDRFLLGVGGRAGVHERTMAHRLAMYLDWSLSERAHAEGYVVDCEYNRNIIDPKTVEVLEEKEQEAVEAAGRKLSDKELSVYPDIVIHRRGMRANLLVIELKKKSSRTNASEELDHLKLRAFTLHGERYRYLLGAELLANDTDAGEHPRELHLLNYWVNGAVEPGGENQPEA